MSKTKYSRCSTCKFFKPNTPNEKASCSKYSSMFSAGGNRACQFYEKREEKKKMAKKKIVNESKRFSDLKRYEGTVSSNCTMCATKGTKTVLRLIPNTNNYVCSTCWEIYGHGAIEEVDAKPKVVEGSGSLDDLIRYKDAETNKCSICAKKWTTTLLRLIPNTRNYLCPECWEEYETLKEGSADETEEIKEPIPHKRYVVVESRLCVPGYINNVYVHAFSNKEKAVEFMENYRVEGCRLIEISSDSPIGIKEFSLGYKIQTGKTRTL